MRHDMVSDALILMNNADAAGKDDCQVLANKTIKSILKLVQENEYISEFEYIEDGRGGVFKINLLHRINKIRIIRPRFSVKKDEFEKWEVRYLPSVNMGLIFVSTPKGIITHRDAKKEGVGGRLIGYVY